VSRTGAIFIKHLRENWGREKFGTELPKKTNPENITNVKDYDKLQILFCISVLKLISNNKKKHYRNLRIFHFPWYFTIGAL